MKYLATAILVVTAALAQPPGEGWVQLLNDDALSGWNNVGNQEWSLDDDGVLQGKAVTDDYGYLQTDRDYKNFILNLKFQCVGTGNSGVYFHTRFKPGTADVSQGAQFEIDCIEGNHTAGVYGFGRGWIVWPATEKESVVRRGAWNEMTVTVRGNRYISELNGVPMVDFTDPDAPYLEGTIALQLHSGGEGHMLFRDIRVRDLTEQ